MLPLSGPGQAGPSLEGNGFDGGTILVADHFAPGSRVGRADLSGTTAVAKETFATGSQAGNGTPVLSAGRFRHTHDCGNPRPSDPNYAAEDPDRRTEITATGLA